MPRLPRVTAGEVLRVVQRNGFGIARQSGSHILLRDVAGHRITVPYHAGRILHPKVLQNILSDAGWTVDQFIAMLSE